MRDSEPSSSASSTSLTIFCAIYKFLYHTSSPREQDFSISSILTTEALMQTSDFSFESLLSMEANAYPEMMDFAKSPNIFDLNFTLGPDTSSPPCSPTQFSSPIQYPQLLSDIIFDEDEQQFLSSASSFDGVDMSNYVSDIYTMVLPKPNG